MVLDELSAPGILWQYELLVLKVIGASQLWDVLDVYDLDSGEDYLAGEDLGFKVRLVLEVDLVQEEGLVLGEDLDSNPIHNSAFVNLLVKASTRQIIFPPNGNSYQYAYAANAPESADSKQLATLIHHRLFSSFSYFRRPCSVKPYTTETTQESGSKRGDKPDPGKELGLRVKR